MSIEIYKKKIRYKIQLLKSKFLTRRFLAVGRRRRRTRKNGVVVARERLCTQ